MNKRVLIFIGAVLVALILLTLYTSLGGFKAVSVSIQPVRASMVLAGVAFQGNMRSPSLDSLFTRVRALHRAGALKGMLGTIYYDVPVAKRRQGDVNAWVGVWERDTTGRLPAGFGRKRLAATQVVRAQLQGHFLVSPSPDEVQEQLRTYARQRGLQIENFLIEKYVSDDSITLEAAIK